VDGSRSIFLAVSPWVKRQYVSKKQLSLSATDLRDLFINTPSFTPYNYTPIAFDGTPNATWKAMTQNLNFSTSDANEVQLRQGIALSEGLPPRKPGKKK
jgi:hypothetical protein